ncbi:MAG TPA: periplasmic heavy metal sensor [Thermoanaerobaculia bacterium]|nr:periplasmic heavy metal sensor [Thermoanaerobaculia bacterium]
MRRWWLVLALLLSLGLNVGILAAIAARRATQMARPNAARQAQGANNPAAGNANNVDPVPRLTRLANRLKLEGDQRRKFLDIQWNLYQETARQRLQLNEIHRALRQELTHPNPDRPRVEGLLSESSQIYLALERSLVNNVFATRDLLGPEKEADYLKIVGSLRVPNPGLGLSLNPGAAAQPRRPGPFQRLRQKLRQGRQARADGQDQGSPDGTP